MLQMIDNPWNVDSIQAFLYLKCPECIFDTQEESTFRDHAFENHPLSFEFFGKKLKDEPMDDIGEHNSDRNENYEEKYDEKYDENYDYDDKNFDLPEIYTEDADDPGMHLYS